MNQKEPDETWKVELELTTKDGRPIEMFYNTNVEGPNRGYICDEITAYVEGEVAGFLKVQNIPASILAKFYPSGALNHACQNRGISIFPYSVNEESPVDIKTADMDILNGLASYLQEYGHVPRRDSFHSRDDFNHWFKTDLKKSRWYKDQVDDFKKFCDFNVDKPFVAYTSTRRPKRGLSEKSFEGMGVAKAMYIAMALELERQGLTLRRSETLFSGATHLWKRFELLALMVPGGQIEDKIQPILSPDRIRELLNISLPSQPSIRTR